MLKYNEVRFSVSKKENLHYSVLCFDFNIVKLTLKYKDCHSEVNL